MADFDENSSHMARKIFAKASSPGAVLSATDFARFLPANPFDFHQPTASAYLSDNDGAQAEVEILTDKANGIYSANITTLLGKTALRSELRISIHGTADAPVYRVDRLRVDNEAIDLSDREQTQNGLLVFLSYKNAAFPTGDGPHALFPRPDTAQAPKAGGPKHDPLPVRRPPPN